MYIGSVCLFVCVCVCVGGGVENIYVVCNKIDFPLHDLYRSRVHIRDFAQFIDDDDGGGGGNKICKMYFELNLLISQREW